MSVVKKGAGMISIFIFFILMFSFNVLPPESLSPYQFRGRPKQDASFCFVFFVVQPRRWQLVGYWILTSSRPHRLTSGQDGGRKRTSALKRISHV